MRLAVENPAERGEFRVFNQLTESFSVGELAKLVADTHPGTEITHLDTPRVEADQHHYHVVSTGLAELGLRPHLLAATLITSMFELVERHAGRVNRAALLPAMQWRLPGR